MTHHRSYHCRRGGTVVLIVLLMVVLIGMVAFAVDLGRLYLVRAQLQMAVDAGALAAALQLREDADDIDSAVAAAQKFIHHNRVGWLETVPKDVIVVEVGTWNEAKRSFTQGGADPDSVRVIARLESEPFVFGKLLGRTSFSVPRSAVAQGGGGSMDILMTLDLSGSMSSLGRIQALRHAAPVFVNVIEDVGNRDFIGVMGYGALPDQYDPTAEGHGGVEYLDAPQSLYPPDSEWVAVLESPLTDDFNALRKNVLNHTTLLANKYNGWTPVGAALRDSAHYLKTNARDGTDRFIVLMSDGHANKPNGYGPGYARDMAGYAAGLGIKVYTISLGNAADEKLMQDIADKTGGEHFIAAGIGDALADGLTEAFRKVANAIKRTQLVQ